jgi:peptidoglycan/xylan/chitin deacetylase (PgdA/CDA1 family)
MYHVIGDGRGEPLPGLYVSPVAFRRQVAWLAAHGYHAVTLDAVYRHWTAGRPLPAKPIVFSFDDGYKSDVTMALPTLRARHWPGVLNLKIDNLVPAQVRRLIAGGWEIDSHTFTHPDLRLVSNRRLRYEVAASRRWIRDVFNMPADFFCYPSGQFDARVIAAVRAAGYLGATTRIQGYASPRNGLWTLHRIRVDGSDGIAGLAAKLGAQ